MKGKGVIFVTSILIALGLSSCVDPKSASDFKGEQRMVSARIQLTSEGQSSTWSPLRQSSLSTLPGDTGTILVMAVDESIAFTNQFSSISSYFDRSLLNLNSSTVTLNLPLNTPLKLFEYAFGQQRSAAGQLTVSDLVIASNSISFMITDSDLGQTKILQSALTLVASPTSITVSPASAELDIGDSVNFTAYGEFVDSSLLGITNFVNWTVSDSSIASVTNSETSKGTVTALTDGIVTVTATLGNVSGTASITAGTVITGPISQNSTITTDQAVDYHFSTDDFPFTETTAGETFTNLLIASLPTGGSLFLDTNFNSLIDSGESVSAGDAIPVASFRYLRYRPDFSGSGTGYDSFTFKVGSENGYSYAVYTMTTNVNAVSYDCPTIGSGSSSDSGVFSGGSACTISNADITVMPGHILTLSAGGNPINSVTINSGGTFVIEGGTIGSSIILNGGILDINDNSGISGDIFHQHPSVIDIQAGKYLDYDGSDIIVGANQLTFLGNGEFHSGSSIHLNNAASHLYISGNGVIENVRIDNTDLNSGLGIEVNGDVELRTLFLGADATINVVSGSLTIKEGLWVMAGAPVNLTTYGMILVGGVVLEASLDIDGVILLGEFASLQAKGDASFGAGSNLIFTGGVIVDPGVVLTIEDEDDTTTVTFPGYSDIEGQIIVEGDESLVFANPPLSDTVFDTFVTDNSTGSVTNIDVDTDLSNLTPLFESDHFCEEGGSAGCTSIEDAILNSHPSYSWFMETNIQGDTYGIHYLPDDVTNPLAGGDIYGREVISETHQWAAGSSFSFLGRYTSTTVNGGMDAIITKAGEFLSMVTWVDSGHLYHAWYYTTDAYVSGYFFDASDDLYVHFNQDMDTTFDVTGVTPDYTPVWDNIRTLRFGLASTGDGVTLTLPMATFRTKDLNYIVQDGSFTIEHFVKVEGQVVDASADPNSWAEVFSSLDSIRAYSDGGGNFTLATLSADPSTDYQVYIHGGCGTTGFVKSGLTPAWQQHVIDCGSSGPTVSSGLYNSTALGTPSAGGITWYYNAPADVTWDAPSFDATGDMDIYILQDDPTGLDATDSATLAANVNSKNWNRSFAGLSNSGIISFDPTYFSEHGSSYRVLVIDSSGNWDISDNDFSVHLVNSSNYKPSALTDPNGSENWHFGIAETISWSTSDLSADTVAIYLIQDDPSILDTTADITTSVNSLKWDRRSRSDFNTGQRGLDPMELGSNGADSRILIIDSQGNWDISDADFTITLVDANKYWPNALTSPNGGETWSESSSETLSWDTYYINSGKLNVFILNDTSTDMDETDPATLTGIVNNKRWEMRLGADAEWGSDGIDPSMLKTGSSFLWLLIIDQEGNWDISDGFFQVVP